jgi:hypothetical protein
MLPADGLRACAIARLCGRVHDLHRSAPERASPHGALLLRRYMRASHFPGWARPHEFNARLLHGIGRREEARDSVRAPPAPHPNGPSIG